VLPSHGELFAYREPNAGRLKVIVDGETKTLASGLASVWDPRVVQLPGGSLDLFASEESGVVSYTSTDGGSNWTRPAKTISTTPAVPAASPGLTVSASATDHRRQRSSFRRHGPGRWTTVHTSATGTESLGTVAPHTAISVHAAPYAPATSGTP
jgi:hypothetical protein